MLLLIGKAAPLDADRRRQVAACDLFENGHRLPRAVSLCRLARDGRRVEHVETADRARSRGVGGRAERRDGNHRLVGAPDEEQPEVFLVGAVRGFGLDVDAVDAVEHVEVVDVDRSGEGLHRREDVGHRHAQHLGLVAVHIEIELRDVVLYRRRKPRQLLALRGVVQQRVDGALKIAVRGVSARFEHQLDAARGAQSRDHGRRREVDLAFGIAAHLPAYAVHQPADVRGLAFVPRLEDHRQLAARLVGPHPRAGPGDVEHVFHVLLRHQVFHGAFRHAARAFERGPFGKFEFDGEIALVLLGHEALGNGLVEHPQRH